MTDLLQSLVTTDNAERTIITQLLADPFAIKDCQTAKLKPGHFRRVEYGEIYRVMLKQQAEIGSFDVGTLKSEFESQGGEAWESWVKKGLVFSELMMEANYIPRLTPFAEIITKEYWKRRVLEHTQKQAKYTLNLNGTPTPEYMNKLNGEWKAMMEAYQAERPLLGVRGADVIAEKLSAHLAGDEKPKRITTGLKPLDSVLAGGLRRKTHTGILAASGTGKTILMKQMAVAMQQAGYHVVYYMLEEDADFIVSRMQAQILKVNSFYVEENITPPNSKCPKCKNKPATEQFICACRKDKAWEKSYWDRYKKTQVDWESNSPTIIDHAIHVDTWADELRAIDQQRKVDAVFVDYGQRVGYSGDQNAAHEKFANELTDMAKELDAVFVTALQVNKAGNAGFTAPPKANDIRGTSAWFNAFRVLLSLYRPMETVDEHGNEVFEMNGVISFQKMRAGLNGTPHPVGVQLREIGLQFAPLTSQTENPKPTKPASTIKPSERERLAKAALGKQGSGK